MNIPREVIERAVVDKLFGILQDYNSATFSWQGNDLNGFEIAKKSHDDECKRRMALVITELRAAFEVPEVEPVAWIVFNTDGTPEYAAHWRDAAHEHIKDMQDRFPDYKEVAQWVVRPVYAAPQGATE